MSDVKDGYTYTITFNTDPRNATDHHEVREMSQSLFGALDDHAQKYFRPREVRTEMVVSERQARSLMDELSIQGLFPTREPAAPAPPPNVEREYGISPAIGLAIIIGGLVLLSAIGWVSMLDHWR